MGAQPSRLWRILEWKLLSPEYKFARPLYVWLDRSNRLVYPALNRLDRLEDRLDALEKAQLRASNSIRLWGCLGILICVPAIIPFVTYELFPKIWGRTMPLSVLITLTIASVLSIPLALFIVKRLVSQKLRRELFNRDGATCPECGYDLRGLDSARCPECGANLQRKNSSGRPKPPAE